MTRFCTSGLLYFSNFDTPSSGIAFSIEVAPGDIVGQSPSIFRIGVGHIA